MEIPKHIKIENLSNNYNNIKDNNMNGKLRTKSKFSFMEISYKQPNQLSEELNILEGPDERVYPTIDTPENILAMIWLQCSFRAFRNENLKRRYYADGIIFHNIVSYLGPIKIEVTKIYEEEKIALEIIQKKKKDIIDSYSIIEYIDDPKYVYELEQLRDMEIDSLRSELDYEEDEFIDKYDLTRHLDKSYLKSDYLGVY